MSSVITNKTELQIQRKINNLKTTAKKTEKDPEHGTRRPRDYWTAQEYSILAAVIREHGRDYDKIQALLPHRSRVRLRHKVQRDLLTKGEDLTLL